MSRSGPVQVGVRFKAPGPSPYRDGPGVVRCCYLAGDLKDQALLGSHPNKAVGVVSCQTFPISIVFRVINSCLLLGLASAEIVRNCGLALPCAVTQQPLVLSWLLRRGLAAHRPRHSPRADVARPPASALPLSPLVSSRSFRHARRAAAHSVVNRCRVRTAPKYSAHFPPTTCVSAGLGQSQHSRRIIEVFFT